ncbi:ankyrin repeat domain-containing protein 39-like [Lingula anatina]|uniref:Ankyrin repeat domain-containing protein 39-like n=1 Tax=Lingula anatina TaxID=7574 RepID=A0A1S3KBP4_LINAN|nr:ankyrin repeat domain-containing protein 39-like [Lingula anatina]|eukprot:XP_013419676.1 ankyrin repeat domain-containing protein 39-like [Lingula anatina]
MSTSAKHRQFHQRHDVFDCEDHGCCSHATGTPSVFQTLDELDFSRGIWSAAMDGDVKKVADYLNKGGDVNTQDNSGYTALHYASRNGHLAVCELLLTSGASVNVQTRAGAATPLHRAAYCGHQDILQLLMKYGAREDMVDSDGKTALHKAAENGHSGCMALLVEKNPSLKSVADVRNKVPRNYVANERTDLLQILS